MLGASATSATVCKSQAPLSSRRFPTLSARPWSRLTYLGICPDKKAGIFLVLIAPVIITLAAVLPDMKLKKE